jgi:hypothetical protein
VPAGAVHPISLDRESCTIRFDSPLHGDYAYRVAI